jgi:hypothetical protein
VRIRLANLVGQAFQPAEHLWPLGRQECGGGTQDRLESLPHCIRHQYPHGRGTVFGATMGWLCRLREDAGMIAENRSPDRTTPVVTRTITARRRSVWLDRCGISSPTGRPFQGSRWWVAGFQGLAPPGYRPPPTPGRESCQTTDHGLRLPGERPLPCQGWGEGYAGFQELAPPG